MRKCAYKLEQEFIKSKEARKIHDDIPYDNLEADLNQKILISILALLEEIIPKKIIRPLTEYQKFCRKLLKIGCSMKEISIQWQLEKDSK